MALVMLGGGVTDIRGSIAGNTFSRSAAGNYMRSRKKPVNSRSPDQNARRANVAYLTKYWSGTLTDQERTDWRAYAQATTWTNKLGQSIVINGLAAFLGLNTLLLLIGEAIRAAAPTATGHAGGVTFTFDAESDTSTIELDEPGGAFDKDTDDHHLLLFMGIPSEAGKISIPKGFKYIGKTSGDSTTPDTYPLDIPAAYTMTAGQRVTVRGMFMDEAFRASGPFWYQEASAPSI